MKKFFTHEYFWFTIIVILAFVLRLYRIDNPIADWHSWRQADTAAVSRNFIKEGFDILHPKVDNFVPVNAYGLPNPQRLFLTEFPIYNAIVAGLYRLWGIHEYLGRLVSVFFSLGSLILIYLLSKSYFGPKTGLIAAFFFAVLPYSIFYSRVFLPEPMMLFGQIGAIYFLSLYLKKEKWVFWVLAIIFAALAYLLKAYSLVLLLPIFYLIWQKYGIGFFTKPKVWFYFILSLLPFIWWRFYISHYPEGIPSSLWLFNQGNIRFKGAFFRWIIAERMDKLILTAGGFTLFILGLIQKPLKKEGFLFYSYLAAIFAYFIIIAKGNITHDYYQVPFIAIAVIFMAKGASFLLKVPKVYLQQVISWLVLVSCVLIMLAFGWYEIRGFYWINRPEIIEAGRAVDKLTPKEAKVIAPYNRDVAFLYQTNRHGWSVVDKPLEQLIAEGASFFVTVDLTPVNLELSKKYKVVKQTSSYLLLDLKQTP